MVINPRRNFTGNKGQSAEFIPAYKRDVIRPNVFGSFENLVLATAKSPAMLTYLDKVTSSGAPENRKDFASGRDRLFYISKN